ncbi:hypothetical protein WJX72_000972 [[Myrmecia] bisecta]|uniref:Uncharacterized protein n=1 Tax=[Myrmecia] bisecta TaxID=41462 RepID=A0AAW1QAY1_9CHLO
MLCHPADREPIGSYAYREVCQSQDGVAQGKAARADGQEHPSILDLQQWPHQDSLLEARSVFQDMLSKHVTPQTDLRPRGIVMPVGGTQLNANAFVSIQVMREVHGCLLPIDLVYYGADEMDVKTRKYFESRFPDVRVVDLATLPYPKHHNRVEVKDAIVRAYAFYHAGFDQVLMLHPDSTPLRDPTYLFDSREFQEAGNLFWPDFWQAMAGQPYVMPPAVFGLLDLPIPRPSDTDLWLSSTDSGQFLFDRKRLPDVLEWSFFVNALGPAFFYHMSQEKDSYHLAFSLAGKAGAFRQVLHMPRAVLAKRLRGKLNYLQVGSLQADPGGRPLFFHRSDGPGRLHPADASSDFLTADLVSIELSEGRALRMFHQPEDGGMGYGMGDVWVTNSTNSCAFDDGLNTQAKIHKECGAYITGTAAPFPVVPVHWFSETAQRTFQATYKALEQLRGEIAGGRLLQAACKRPGSPAGIQCMKPAR